MDRRIQVGPADQVPWFRIEEADGAYVLHVAEGTPIDIVVLRILVDLIGGGLELGQIAEEFDSMNEKAACRINDLITGVNCPQSHGG